MELRREDIIKEIKSGKMTQDNVILYDISNEDFVYAREMLMDKEGLDNTEIPSSLEKNPFSQGVSEEEMVRRYNIHSNAIYYMGLSNHDIGYLSRLLHLAYGKRDYCFPSISTLAKRFDMNRSTITRNNQKLAEAGVIQIVSMRSKKSNNYLNIYFFHPDIISVRWLTKEPLQNEPEIVKQARGFLNPWKKLPYNMEYFEGAEENDYEYEVEYVQSCTSAVQY